MLGRESTVAPASSRHLVFARNVLMMTLVFRHGAKLRLSSSRRSVWRAQKKRGRAAAVREVRKTLVNFYGPYQGLLVPKSEDGFAAQSDHARRALGLSARDPRLIFSAPLGNANLALGEPRSARAQPADSRQSRRTPR